MADNFNIDPSGATAVASDDIGGVQFPRSKLIHGADGTNDGDVSTTNPLPIRTSSKITASGNTVTRPSDTAVYANGDFLANSTTAASCTIANSGFTVAVARANDAPGRLYRCKLEKSNATTTNAVFRVHIFNVNPLASAPANGDNGAFLPALKTGYLGRFDVTVNEDFGDGSVGFGVPTEGNYIDFTPATGTQNVFALLEVRAAYTPASAEVFTLTLITE